MRRGLDEESRYTFDHRHANGNRTTLTDGTGTTTFGYDALNRLTSAAYPGTYGTWSWTYDQVGNRLTQNSPSGQTNYGYDANNRLTSAGGATYAYDNNGNLTSISSGTSFTYDAHNRLSQANLPGGLVVQYTYNGDGLKIRRIEGTAVTRYYHDGIRPLYETRGDGTRNADLERDIFGNLLARQDARGTRFYYHHDGLGSTVALTDASGAVAAQRSYDAWGNRRTSSGSAPGNYQFTGAELDPTSGLYHMGARFYDPTIGRWLSEDPMRGQVFEPVTLNLYAYVRNNPVYWVDPTGLEECDLACLNAQRQAAAILALAAQNPVLAYRAYLEISRVVGHSGGLAALQAFSGESNGTLAAGPIISIPGLGTADLRRFIEGLYWIAVAFLGLEGVVSLASLFFASSDPRGWALEMGRNPILDIGAWAFITAALLDSTYFRMDVLNNFTRNILCRNRRC